MSESFLLLCLEEDEEYESMRRNVWDALDEMLVGKRECEEEIVDVA